MFGMRWQIFRLLGIPIYIDASWLVIFALLTLSLAAGFPLLLEQLYGELPYAVPPWQYWLMALVTALAFFTCIVLHELGHAVVGRQQGMPIRGITLFLFGGVAELGEEPSSAKSEFLMAIAGPAVTVVLAVLFGLATWWGVQVGWAPLVVMVLGYLTFINALVLAFNMIPAFPLDGGRVLRSLLWAMSNDLRQATWWASLAGRAFAWTLIAFGLLQLLYGNWLGGIWAGLLGLFLNMAAQSGYQHVLVRQVLEGEPVHRFMNRSPVSVPANLGLQQWLDDYIYQHHYEVYPVMTDGRLEGMVTTRDLPQVPRAEWEQRTVADLMRRDLEQLTIPLDADAMEALRKMQQVGTGRLLVTDGDGQLVGILSLRDLLRFFNLKLELERR